MDSDYEDEDEDEEFDSDLERYEEFGDMLKAMQP